VTDRKTPPLGVGNADHLRAWLDARLRDLLSGEAEKVVTKLRGQSWAEQEDLRAFPVAIRARFGAYVRIAARALEQEPAKVDDAVNALLKARVLVTLLQAPAKPSPWRDPVHPWK
jgi:hypothetical protein